MLKIFQYEIYKCEKCGQNYSEKNKPHILICGNTICEKCLNQIVKNDNETQCFFDKNHFHKNDENFPINYTLLTSLGDLKNLVDLIYIKRGDLSKIKKSFINENIILKNKQYKCEDFSFNGELNNNNKPIGNGKLIHNKFNLTIEGTFKNDFDKGNGKIIYNNGDVYIGEFENFKKNGEGDLTYKNGDKYKGPFKNDKLEGQGILIKKNEKIIIKGNFENNFPNGEGYLYKKDNEFPKKVLFLNGKEEKILIEEDKTAAADIKIKGMLKNL